MAHILKGGLAEADPADEPTHIPAPLGQGLHSLAHLAVKKAEVACVAGDINLGYRAQNPVKHAGRQFLQGRLAEAALSADYVESFPPDADHLRDEFRGSCMSESMTTTQFPYRAPSRP